MKRIKNWMLIAALIGGGSLMTSCDCDDATPASSNDEVRKERQELLQVIEDDTEIIDGSMVNDGMLLTAQVNAQLMTKMGRGRHFIANMKQLIAMMAVKNALENIKAVEQGSQLEEMGYKAYIPVDISAFGLHVLFNDRGDYNITPANGLEFVFPATVQGLGTTLYKMAFRNSGEWYESVTPAHFGNVQYLACVNRIPKTMTMTLSGLFDGEEKTLVEGTVNIELENDDASRFVSFRENDFRLSGEIRSNLKAVGLGEDDSCLGYDFAFSQDGTLTAAFDYTQKGLKLMDFNTVLTLSAGDDFVSQLSDYVMHFSNAEGIEDHALDNVFPGGKAEMSINILDGLLMAGSIGNVAEYIKTLQDLKDNCKEGSSAADWNKYLKVLNQQCDMTLTSTKTTSLVPMQILAEQRGEGLLLLPSLKFADMSDYHSLSELVSSKTIDSLGRIMASSAQPMGNAGSYMVLLSRVMQMMPLNSEEWGFK